MDSPQESWKNTSGHILKTTYIVASTAASQEQSNLTTLFKGTMISLIIMAVVSSVAAIIKLVRYIIKEKRDKDVEKQAPVAQYRNIASSNSSENITFIMPSNYSPEAVLDITHHPEGIESGLPGSLDSNMPQQPNAYYCRTDSLHPVSRGNVAETLKPLLDQSESECTQDYFFISLFVFTSLLIYYLNLNIWKKKE